MLLILQNYAGLAGNNPKHRIPYIHHPPPGIAPNTNLFIIFFGNKIFLVRNFVEEEL